jgi:hypothetical protein
MQLKSQLSPIGEDEAEAEEAIVCFLDTLGLWKMSVVHDESSLFRAVAQQVNYFT